MKYFVKKQHSQPTKKTSKKIVSSISDKELVKLKQLKETVKKFLNLTKEEHEQFVLNIAEAESLKEKFIIDPIDDFTSDIFINDNDTYIRVITNKEILTPDDISDFINKIIDVDPKSSTIYTPALLDSYYSMFGIPFISMYNGLEFADFLKSNDLINT
ncbi:hypothetical protein Dip518_001409 [Parelusimicrobium proximum]|uniref:hypothetical protein n=1 Tax=Parelusimicrobium proximum TaxID=3228953 RepID=UPI003D183F25